MNTTQENSDAKAELNGKLRYTETRLYLIEQVVFLCDLNEILGFSATCHLFMFKEVNSIQ